MSINKEAESLSLYHYQSCPFCGITRQAIKYLNVDIEQRDVLLEPKFREELVKGGGKAQVPCLKIESKNGTTKWLYESSDIINYLQTNTLPLKESA